MKLHNFNSAFSFDAYMKELVQAKSTAKDRILFIARAKGRCCGFLSVKNPH